MLHLCGYDHIDDAERLEMEKHQEAILEILKIRRDME
jgi:ssRNA-specific RNase YbeY (16S rRNA maturation enzyme)